MIYEVKKRLVKFEKSIVDLAMSSVKWTVLAHFKSQPRGQNFQAQT